VSFPTASLPAQPVPSPLSRQDRLAQLHAPATSKQAYISATSSRTPQSARLPGPAESFVLLPPSAAVPTSSPVKSSFPSASSPTSTTAAKEEKPTKQTLISSLLELVSSRTDTDHPLCSECARLLQEVLKERLEDVKKERDGYIAFERKYKAVENGGRKSDEDVEALRKRLESVSWRSHLDTFCLACHSRLTDLDLSHSSRPNMRRSSTRSWHLRRILPR
jgi:hypothetical protein